MLPQEVIAAKRDGTALTPEQIRFMIEGLTDETISEGQVAAFAMLRIGFSIALPPCVRGCSTRMAFRAAGENSVFRA